MWDRGEVLQEGRYTVIRRLGGGGFGLTYLATDNVLGRQVVIKTPDDKFQADQDYERYVRRFQREGQTLAKIEHPNIVKVFGFFKETRMPCLVMAYVEGETLNERLRKQEPLKEDEAVEIFRKLAAALHKVHDVGIFHCDIHPGNIILQHSREPVLIDFGSAKRLVPTTVTVTTTVNESFSPYEQRNTNNKPKATLDIYSLAATFFFAITGIKPVSSINRKLYGDSLEFPQASRSKLSQWVQNAILNGMALEQQNRPLSMKAWLALLYPTQVITKKTAADKRPILQLRDIPTAKEKQAVQTSYEKSLQHHHFPWISLSLFFLSNMPTGVCLWTLGTTSENAVSEAWYAVLLGATFVTFNAAMAGMAVWAGAIVLTESATLAWLISLIGTLAFSGIGAFTLALTAAKTIAWAGAGTVAGALAWAWVVPDAAGVVLSFIVAITWSIAMAGSGVTAIAATGFGFAGASWAGIKTHELGKDISWIGIGGSATALAGFMAGLSSALIDNSALDIAVLILSGLQIFLMVKSLHPVTVSLSNRASSKVKSFTILNTACVLGIICGASLMWWFSLTT